jgi:hypothetical protein
MSAADKRVAEAQVIWKKYEKGVTHHHRKDLYESTAQAYRMYEGDQWYGLEGGEKLPVYNFIQPIVEYKTAMVAMQNIQIFFSPLDTIRPGAMAICDALNRYARQRWERQKLDSLLWKAVRDACIAGESFLYFYNSNLDCQILDNTAVYLGDEQQPDLQKQPYIIIYERRLVDDVRAEAKRNGLTAEEIALIVPDSSLSTVVGDTEEVDPTEEGGGKCGCLLYLYRGADGFVHIKRSTKDVVYQPDTVLTGLKRYPLVSFVWMPRKNSARGVGEVQPLVQNQIEANRLLVRRLISAKLNAFAKPVYVENMIENPADIDKVGKAIRLRGGNVQRVQDLFSYIAPAPMSQEAALLSADLLGTTRELAGTGDAVLGMVNPERASGAAILAVQDQASIPINEHIAAFKQTIEDIALIWLEIWCAYERKELWLTEEMDGRMVRQSIPATALRQLELSVRVDATAATPYSRYATEQAVEAARNAGYITFEEYVEALPAHSIAPKALFRMILNKRKKELVQKGMGLDGNG